MTWDVRRPADASAGKLAVGLPSPPSFVPVCCQLFGPGNVLEERDLDVAFVTGNDRNFDRAEFLHRLGGVDSFESGRHRGPIRLEQRPGLEDLRSLDPPEGMVGQRESSAVLLHLIERCLRWHPRDGSSETLCGFDARLEEYERHEGPGPIVDRDQVDHSGLDRCRQGFDRGDLALVPASATHHRGQRRPILYGEVVESLPIFRTNSDDDSIDIARSLEGPDGVIDQRPVTDRQEYLVDLAPDANTPPAGKNDRSKVHQPSVRVAYRTVAAISASGERTDRSRVTCPKRWDPLNFSIKAAIPPNGEI